MRVHYAGAPRRAPGAGRRRGDCRARRRDRDRAQQSLRLDRARSSRSTRSALRSLRRRRVPCVAVSPLIGGRAVKGPRRPHAHATRRRQRRPGDGRERATRGLIDALVIDEADAPAPSCPAWKCATVWSRRRRHDVATPKLHGAGSLHAVLDAAGLGGRVRVAILGGTGSFWPNARRVRLARGGRGRGGDRLARRRARLRRRRSRASARSVDGRDERRCCRRRRPGRARRQGRGRSRHRATRSAVRLERRPFSRSRQRSPVSRLGGGPLPDPDRPLARRANPGSSSQGPVIAGLHSIAAANLERGAARRGRADLR